MRQGSCVPRFGLEAGLGLGLQGVTGMQQLDGDRPGQNGIGGSPYLAVPAGGDPFIRGVTITEERRGNGHQRPLPPIPGFNHRADLA
jgi:hypothetical protein